jgi:2-succinyl-6-hydroxy-2,4-cyclohexadiene-1-carboxylate synthase
MIRWNTKILGISKTPVLIFLHGFLGSLKDWLPLARRFSSEYRCLLFDLPGHGKTETSRISDYSISATAKSLVKYLQDRNIFQSVLVGYSMGGRLALYLAVNYPDYFEKLILESTSPGLSNVRERMNRRINDERLANEMERLSVEEFLQRWYNQPLFKSLKCHPEFEELYRRRRHEKNVNWAASLRGMGTGRQPSLWHKLGSINIPVFILVGEKDQKFRNIANQMETQNPNFSISVIPRCGHVIHVEDAEKFYSEVIKFLNNTRRYQ